MYCHFKTVLHLLQFLSTQLCFKFGQMKTKLRCTADLHQVKTWPVKFLIWLVIQL